MDEFQHNNNTKLIMVVMTAATQKSNTQEPRLMPQISSIDDVDMF
jgi:hypothetical protein